MASLAAFGVCVTIIIVLVVLIGLFASPALILLLFIPATLCELITGERGTFSPNGGSKKSPVFNLLMALFTIVEVLFLGAILFGLYSLIAAIFGIEVVSTNPASTHASNREVLSALELYRLEIINTLLLLLMGTFILMWITNLVKFRDQLKKVPVIPLFFSWLLPLLTYPLAILFLASSRNYITHYPNGDHYIGFFSRSAAILYSIFLVYSQIKGVYTYFTVFRKHEVALGFQYWFNNVTGIFYKIVFIYFTIRILMSL